ncbi:Interferon-inducible GTPase (IIGP) [Stygiomarasmius scandens]|uniref:Interferon-inducible GTPase (IIGP) n=1 Tax=Marasmiellus scandens TaxID=2682957 RepID=A0ABR1IS38_9AGAR
MPVRTPTLPRGSATDVETDTERPKSKSVFSILRGRNRSERRASFFFNKDSTAATGSDTENEDPRRRQATPSLTSQIDSLKAELEKERSSMESRKGDNDKLKSEIEEVKGKMGVLEKERDEWKDKAEKETEEKDRLVKDLEEATKAKELEVAHAREQVAEAQTALEAAVAAKDEAERAAEEARKNQVDAELRLEEERSAKEKERLARETAERDAQAQADIAREESQSADAAREAFHRAIGDMEKLKEESEELRKTVEELKAVKDKLEEEMKESIDLAEEHRLEAEDTKAALLDVKQQLTRANSIILESETKVENVGALVKLAEEGAKKAESELASLRALVEEQRQGREMAEQKLRDAELRSQQLAQANTESREAEEKTRNQLRNVIARNLSRRDSTASISSNPAANDYEAVRKARKFKEGFVHVAVVGTAGSGKSSLVNALRGVLNATSTAAPTGLQTELTTTTIGRYPDNRKDCRIIWYDVPGSGSSLTPQNEYFNRQGLYVFDCLCLVWDSRLTAGDISVLESAIRLKIPVYLVRTKSDVHLADIEDVMKAKIEADVGAGSAGVDSAKRKAARLNAVPADALGKYITQTRQSVDMSLRRAKLPPVKAYMVSAKSVLKVVQSGTGMTPDGVRVIDDRDLVGDVTTLKKTRR